MDNKTTILIKNTQQKIKINIGEIKQNIQKMLTVAGYSDFDISIWFTTNATIKKFNKKYRKKDISTDILSFPYHTKLEPGQKIIPQSSEDKTLGDLIISLERVKKDAAQLDQTFKNRLNIIIAHGITHLFGYDHKTNSQHLKMSKIEKKLLKSLE